jgi:hypothetical protein
MNEEQMRKAMKGEYNPFNDKDDDSSGDTGVF